MTSPARDAAKDRADDLGRALEAMHRAILKADLRALGVLSDQVEGLLADFPSPGERTAESLHRQASRNAACLAAAARGLRSARRRLREVTSSGAGFATYDAKGGRSDVAALSDRLCRRV